ncbi:hypothetical protein BCV70DRAFT_105877 [Testicularia cyperi]|uniref:Uncharacterized protein n=1 Tax=Testicularia cyperi TaxID=1882483 RepID=A0A317XPD9_9BASI|nr:hypothetical protein BCV70DRAFT_105877 [Testicularia cyperi]
MNYLPLHFIIGCYSQSRCFRMFGERARHPVSCMLEIRVRSRLLAVWLVGVQVQAWLQAYSLVLFPLTPRSCLTFFFKAPKALNSADHE